MKTFLLSAIAAVLCSAFCVAQDKPEEYLRPYPEVWSVTEGLVAPESAYFDAASGFLFLSQIGDGGGKAKDGDGWISKLTPDGKVVENVWVPGFNAPKGLRSHGNTLWVSDIDRIVAIDIEKGEISKEVVIPDAQFLNDLATGEDGTVYVTDMVASKVYQYKDGQVSVFAEGDELQNPNGCLVDGEHLVLGGWGKGFNPEDFTTQVGGQLLKVHRTTKKVTAFTPEPTGYLDGIEKDGHGGYYVTDWRNGKVFHINAKGESQVIMTFPQGAADLAYLVDRHLLILPRMKENTLTAFEVK
ncbi:MAG: SMP-30/gluconolactonase/LRE family protein [Planctomycetaceae bacterium]|nr:SMP-30/gluconolactonase/LRE family protein [Planctomycetaceae bacterium]